MPRKSKVPSQHKIIIAKEWSIIADTIKSKRKSLGWTQESVAQKLDCEVTTVQAYEQKRRHPSLPTFLMLCKILKLKITVE